MRMYLRFQQLQFSFIFFFFYLFCYLLLYPPAFGQFYHDGKTRNDRKTFEITSER